jgi:hypothetical protein
MVVEHTTGLIILIMGPLSTLHKAMDIIILALVGAVIQDVIVILPIILVEIITLHVFLQTENTFLFIEN